MFKKPSIVNVYTVSLIEYTKTYFDCNNILENRKFTTYFERLIDYGCYSFFLNKLKKFL